MNSRDSEVIIIGGDHHNTLSVIRCFGKNKIPFTTLIHDNNKDINQLMVKHSKYTKKIYLLKNDERDITKWLLNNKNTKYKQVIIPCSDLAEYAIDNNYDKLNNYYLIPGFKDKPGMVVKMMDKFEQKKWADKNKIPMAKSWIISKKDNYIIPKDIVFPCIIKPNISAFGNKNDIQICNNIEELKVTIKKLKLKKYKEIIIQKFLIKDYEICALGCILDKKRINYGGIIQKIRENPPNGGGSLTFAKYINDKDITKAVNNVLNKLYDEGYRGLYDIEFLKCRDDIYLNEINFRHSGNGYSLIKNGIECPYLLYLNCKQIQITRKNCLKNKNAYFIDELNELSLVKNKYITPWQFIKDFYNSSYAAKFDFFDIGVMFFVIKNKLYQTWNRRK